MARALIISDDLGIRYLYEVAITYQKIAVDTADSITRALKTIESKKPDIVILDISTPDFKDVDLLKEIKLKAEDLPLIILTDMKNPNREEAASILGACHYLVRGESSLGDLIKTVRKAVN